MDVVYPIKAYDSNSELRYSLRSLENLPHDRVFVAGYKPEWMADEVIHIPVDQSGYENKYVKTARNLEAVANHPDLSDNFILMNDDFFIMQPQQVAPVHHAGPLNDTINWRYKQYPQSPYTNGLIKVFHRLEALGVSEPLSYELHVPMVINKYSFLEALEIAKDLDGFGKRTIYGNLNKIRGTQLEDPKFTNPNKNWEEDIQFVSTDEGSFRYHKIGRWIREKFPEKSKYEKVAEIWNEDLRR